MDCNAVPTCAINRFVVILRRRLRSERASRPVRTGLPPTLPLSCQARPCFLIFNEIESNQVTNVTLRCVAFPLRVALHVETPTASIFQFQFQSDLTNWFPSGRFQPLDIGTPFIISLHVNNNNNNNCYFNSLPACVRSVLFSEMTPLQTCLNLLLPFFLLLLLQHVCLCAWRLNGKQSHAPGAIKPTEYIF